MYKFLLTHRRIILFVCLLGIVAGFISLQKMPITMYPPINKPTVFVSLSHPSYTAEDFSDAYGTDIQNQINTIEDVDKTEILINNRFTQIQITFAYGIDADEAAKRVRSAFDLLKSSLPEESRDYGIGWGSETVNEMDIVLFSSEIDETALYNLAKPIILDYLGKIPNAESVDIFPVESLRVTLTLNPDSLFSYGLGIDSVVNAIRSGYKNSSVGSFRQNGTDISLRVKKDIDSGFDVGEIVIAEVGSKTVRLKDIADIKIEYGPSWASFRINGNRAVVIQVIPKKDGNLINLSNDVIKAIKQAFKELPDHVFYEVVMDPATFIQKSINNVVQSAVVGALLAFLCIILLIGEIRNSIIIGISIPLSVILAFILMFAFGVTINLISLSGLALAVGMIVDASIVTMENIYRHREEELQANDGVITDYVRLVGDSTREVAASVIGSTITSVCVFLPLSFTSPLTANILGDIALTVVFTLICSLLVALFVIPLIAFYVYRTKKPVDVHARPRALKRFSTAITDAMIRAYVKMLNVFLKSKTKSIVFIVASVVALVLCVIFLAPRITREIIAAPQGNIVQIYFRNSDTKTQDELVEAAQPLEHDLLTNYPGIDLAFSQITDRSGNILVQLKSSSLVPKFIDALEQKYQSDDTWTYNIQSWDPSAMPLPQTDALHIRVEGPDRREIFVLMERIVDLIKKSDLYRWVGTSPRTTLATEVIMRPRSEAFASMPEFTPSRLTGMLQYLLQGAKVITIKIDNEEQDLYLRYPEGALNTIQDIENFQIPYNGKSVPLKHFFTFEEASGISQLVFTDDKENYNIYASMKMDTPSWKQSDYEKQIKALVAEQITVPAGYRIVFEDTQKDINEAITSLLLALALSVLLIYVALGIQFNSTRIPFIILVTIPFGFIGVILSLFIFKSTLSLNSMLGAILLCGIVVNNAIIIIDFYLNARPNFDTRIEAIIYVVKLRFRPILITTMTTILGMLPIAFAIGDGANIIQPLGIAVSGGLAFSTFFTLFMVPVILNFIEIYRKKDT